MIEATDQIAAKPVPKALEELMGRTGDEDSSGKTRQLTPQHNKEVVYTPFGHLGLGLAAWREMFQELIDGRELIWRLYLRDFSARYRQSMLGYVWAIIPALVTAITFTWLNKSGRLPIGGTALPYSLFVLLNMSVWQLFANGLTGATQSLVNAGALITKINFPRESLVIAAFGQSVFQFIISCVLVAVAFIGYHINDHNVTPAWTVVFIPLAVLPLCLLTLGLGYILSLINGVLRDAGQVITFILMFWMFLTPVVYPAPEHSGKIITYLNPVSPFLVATQDLAQKGGLTHPGGYLIGCVVSLIVFLLGWRVFHLTEPRIAERV